jgi:hypothetical protein
MFSRNFFSDHLSPVSLLLLRNTRGRFRLEGRRIKFTDEGGARTLFFKEGIVNKILEMLELFLFYSNSFFLFRKLKRESDAISLMLFSFPFLRSSTFLIVDSVGNYFICQDE